MKLVIHNAMAINHSLYRKLPYDTLRDFAQVAFVGLTTFTLVVHPGVPARSVTELVALAKAKPGALNYASTGAGGESHLAMEYFKLMTGTDFVNIPYKGSGPAIVAMLSGGAVQVFFTTASSVQNFIQNGRLRAVAAAVSQRIPTMPSLPTLEEQGIRGMDVTGNYGLLAPAGTVAHIVTFLKGEVGKVLAMQEVRDSLARQGAFVAPSTPRQFMNQVKADMDKWREVVRITGMRPG